jgi:hypothetical protein
MNVSTAWLIIQVALSLLPKIIAMIQEEQSKQVGRDEIVKTVLKRFEDVEARAKAARDAATSNIDNGMRDDQFKRD